MKLFRRKPKTLPKSFDSSKRSLKEKYLRLIPNYWSWFDKNKILSHFEFKKFDRNITRDLLLLKLFSFLFCFLTMFPKKLNMGSINFDDPTKNLRWQIFQERNFWGSFSACYSSIMIHRAKCWKNAKVLQILT